MRATAEPISQFDDDLKKLTEEMRAIMHQDHGMGLAAPQIGQSIKLVVIEYAGNEDDPAIPFTVLVNPEVIWSSDNTVVMTEGCLSVPGMEGEVRRPKMVTVTATDVTGQPFKIKAKGLLARVLQHEIDHLYGVLYIDKLVPGTTVRPVELK